MQQIEILVAQDVQLLDVSGPMQVFASANVMSGKSLYRIDVVSLSGGAVRSSAGLAFATSRPGRRAAQTLVVAGGEGMRAVVDDPAHVAFVRGRRAMRVASVCTGAFLLAASGRLDGRRATTHWKFCDALAAAFPAVRVEPNPIYVRDGAVWSSAGVTAGIDLALAMVEADHGPVLALEVARHLVVFRKRPGGQAQFAGSVPSDAAAAGQFDALMDWIASNLRRPLSLADLAARAGMSERSFLRHWRAATGTTPARAVEDLRIEAAQQALGATRMPIKRIAARCGFGSEETMRRCFQKRFAVSPQAWRERFSSLPAISRTGAPSR